MRGTVMLWGASTPLAPVLQLLLQAFFDATNVLGTQGASKQDASQTVPSGSAGGVQLQV
jgi:hypothetical protein